MGWPPKIRCVEVDALVQDLFDVIRSKETRSHYTNDQIICALEMVKTRIIASEVLNVQSDSER